MSANRIKDMIVTPTTLTLDLKGGSQENLSYQFAMQNGNSWSIVTAQCGTDTAGSVIMMITTDYKWSCTSANPWTAKIEMANM